MIIAGMYLRGSAPYFFAAMATALVGAVMLLEHLRWIPTFPMHFPSDPPDAAAGRPVRVGRVCGLYQRFVDHGLFHHFDSPLRGPRTPRFARRRRCWALANWSRESPIK